MSMFGKRDYVWLSSVARDMRRNYADATKNPDLADLAIETLADALAADSPGFDKALFLKNVYKPVEDLEEFFADMKDEEDFRAKVQGETLKSVI